MKRNPLRDLERYGQSVWLDFISRDLLATNSLAKLIDEDGLKGLTSNPIIFEKAIAQSNSYDHEINNLILKHKNSEEIYENLAIKDIQDAADSLKTVFEKTDKRDGFVSLELSPHLAKNSLKTIEEARRLWHEVNRPNLMIKIPGTPEGIKTIRVLISENININVTLLFSVDAYRDAAMAYLYGLKDRADKNLDISSVSSVASFFISRIDSKIDDMLSKENSPLAQSLLGRVAIANAQCAYRAYEEIYLSDLAKNLVAHGAHPQRLLWASTGTKNNKYSDILYIKSLIAHNTVNTMPPQTLEAFRDHGKASDTIKNNCDDAFVIMANLKKLHIDFAHCCDELLSDGLKLFADAFDKLLKALEDKISQKKNSP
jgi:transaldolase/glucose-6-phosphate isomerase